MVVFFLGPVCLIMLFISAVRFNSIFLRILPVILMGLLLFYNWDFYVMAGRAFVKHCLLWCVLALILSQFVSLKLPFFGKMVTGFLAVSIACIASIWAASGTVTSPVPAQTLASITQATARCHPGDSAPLEGDNLSQFRALMEEMTVERDILEQSREKEWKDNDRWYSVEGVLSDGEDFSISFFKPGDDPELMRVEIGNSAEYYKAENENQDLAASWISGRVEQKQRSETLDRYRQPLKTLKDSFALEGTVCSFTVPQELPANLEITIVALPEEKNSVVYFLEDQQEIGGWIPGETYSFDVSAYGSYRYIHLSAKVSGYKFDLVNIFPMLPENMQSQSPQDRFFDSGI